MGFGIFWDEYITKEQNVGCCEEKIKKKILITDKQKGGTENKRRSEVSVCFSGKWRIEKTK